MKKQTNYLTNRAIITGSTILGATLEILLLTFLVVKFAPGSQIAFGVVEIAAALAILHTVKFHQSWKPEDEVEMIYSKLFVFSCLIGFFSPYLMAWVIGQAFFTSARKRLRQ